MTNGMTNRNASTKDQRRAEKRTSARQARVAYNHPTRAAGVGWKEQGRLTAGRHTRVGSEGRYGGCVRDDRQRYRIHSGRDIAARFANFQQQAARRPSPLPPPSLRPSLRRSMHLEAPVRRCVVESLINWI